MINYIDILICPKCSDDVAILKLKKNYLKCTICDNNYDIIKINNHYIPNLLINDEHTLHHNPKDKSNLVNFFSNNKRESSINIDTLSLLTLDVGCGENPRGNFNIDTYIPEEIPSNFILANSEKLPFKSNSFDKILSYYNIEHLSDPVGHVNSLFRIANNEIYIVTDNSEWVGDIFFRIIGSGRIFHQEHCFKWSVEYMENMLNRTMARDMFNVELKNLSTSKLVNFFYLFHNIPKMKYFLSRDLTINIKKV